MLVQATMDAPVLNSRRLKCAYCIFMPAMGFKPTPS